MMLESPKETTLAIKELCAAAYCSYDAGDYKKALRTFYQGWLLLPKPQTHYQEAGWLLIGIGDTYYRLGQHIPACEALKSANHCQSTRDNPFIHLRLGQCLFQMGEKSTAKGHLLLAHKLGGVKIFSNEPEFYYQLIAHALL